MSEPLSIASAGRSGTLPATRAECPKERPCPHARCRHNLKIEIRSGRIYETKAVASCALDIADEGEHSQVEVAHALGTSRQRVQQLEETAIAKLKRSARTRARLAIFLEDEPELRQGW